MKFETKESSPCVMALSVKAEADETVWKRVWSEEEKISFASTPMFLVRGRK